MLPLGTAAPAFSLPSTTGDTVSLEDFDDRKALLVAFICNHCPYVIHLKQDFAERAARWMSRGIGVVAINANDAANYPDDAPDRMVADAQRYGYSFPYLYDERQEVARAYGAACTPDFFLFDGARQLVYRGRYDARRPGNPEPVTGADLEAAVIAVLDDRPVPDEQFPSMGCNIKWRPDNEPSGSR